MMCVALHELRGALAALELGLSLAERKLDAATSNGLGSTVDLRPELGPCLVSMRAALGRATVAVEEIDGWTEAPAAGQKSTHGGFDVTTLIAGKVRGWSGLAPAYRACVQLSWPAKEVEVRGDRRAFERAFDNLLANALEHGGRDVLVEGELREGTVRVVISDGGPGPGRALNGASAPGPLNGNGRSRHGHGLQIARAIIERHGGRLEPGAGAHGPGVVLELPVLRAWDTSAELEPEEKSARLALRSA